MLLTDIEGDDQDSAKQLYKPNPTRQQAAAAGGFSGLLILTCTGVSPFFTAGNDGQKGMGLIMLILIGTVPPPRTP